jgi:hypothetical protein
LAQNFLTAVRVGICALGFAKKNFWTSVGILLNGELLNSCQDPTKCLSASF